MSINLDLIGTSTDPLEASWSEFDVQLYAMGVGAGQNPLVEIDLAVEDSSAGRLRAIPTHALVLAQKSTRLWGAFGDYSPSAAVHARQTLEALQPWPTSGTATLTSTVVDMFEAGKNAIIVTDTTGVDERGEPLFTARRWVLVRGEGGFGGQSAPDHDWKPPHSSPDHTAVLSIRPEQALLYRLCGDRNPMHADPEYARRAGFDVPILHGLCTLGFAARALMRDGMQLKFIDGRFRAPVTPGDDLVLLDWHEGGDHWFEVRLPDGRVAIDRGRARLTSGIREHV